MRCETGMVRPCGEKDRRRCSTDNKEDGSGSTPKYVNTKTGWSDVIRKHTKETGVKEEAEDRRT